MINLKQALIDPSSVFETPEDVLFHTDLTREQKIEILKRWESDIREVQVAEYENMPPVPEYENKLGKDVLLTLENILNALHTLNAKIDLEHTPPTTQGG